ncbi:hypothetical protein CW705_03575, partial [Candidatus Bathyarchaeota archaeon]
IHVINNDIVVSKPMHLPKPYPDHKHHHLQAKGEILTFLEKPYDPLLVFSFGTIVLDECQ